MIKKSFSAFGYCEMINWCGSNSFSCTAFWATSGKTIRENGLFSSSEFGTNLDPNTVRFWRAARLKAHLTIKPKCSWNIR